MGLCVVCPSRSSCRGWGGRNLSLVSPQVLSRHKRTSQARGQCVPCKRGSKFVRGTAGRRPASPHAHVRMKDVVSQGVTELASLPGTFEPGCRWALGQVKGADYWGSGATYLSWPPGSPPPSPWGNVQPQRLPSSGRALRLSETVGGPLPAQAAPSCGAVPPRDAQNTRQTQ